MPASVVKGAFDIFGERLTFSSGNFERCKDESNVKMKYM
ncbi:MAG: hypothetical protein JWQ27_212 [Ferruginibacter sp.]|nr:hypothetical protein [Ferruginibacter sp.]